MDKQEPLRLQKFLSQCGIASRRKAEELIAAGRVTVNGNLATLGDSADPERDTILVDGAALPAAGAFVAYSAASVRGPAMPSAVMPAAVWNA